MNEKKTQELRELVESELKDVATIKKRVEDATRTWSPGRLLDERIPEEIARFDTHAASLQRVLDKIDEESPKLEIQPKIEGMRVAVYIKKGELTIVSRKSDGEVSNSPTDIAGSVYQCNTCGSLFLAFGAIKGYCEGCPDCRSADIRKVPIESAESEKVINTVTYHCVTCGERFDTHSDAAKADYEGCPKCGSHNIYRVPPKETEE